jgi:hypothetical protein
MASLSSKAISGQRKLNDLVVVVPSSSAVISDTDARIYQISVCETTGNATLFTVLDGAGNAIVNETIPALGQRVYSWQEGVRAAGGATWVAGAANRLHAAVEGYRVG